MPNSPTPPKGLKPQQIEDWVQEHFPELTTKNSTQQRNLIIAFRLFLKYYPNIAHHAYITHYITKLTTPTIPPTSSATAQPILDTVLTAQLFLDTARKITPHRRNDIRRYTFVEHTFIYELGLFLFPPRPPGTIPHPPPDVDKEILRQLKIHHEIFIDGFPTITLPPTPSQ